MASPKLQPVRGTHDLLPEQARKFRFVSDTARQTAERYGYGEIATPIFEFSEIFHRTLGDTSDVVTKETYTFTDRGGESLTLRPEFTAGVARAFITAGLQQDLPQKFFYSGPAFRYERPQKGRQRQFHQIGVELLGVEGPLGDVEIIALAAHTLESLGLKNLVQLELNSLGDKESRAAYREALVHYFTGHKASLSEESCLRLEKNPLRILDSKSEEDRRICANAPQMQDYFTHQARDFFAQVTESLDSLKISYRINPTLVRGLDYYSHTVFEFTTESLGAQNTVLAGGRYDHLIATMGGPDTPGTGWAAGIERLVALIDFSHDEQVTVGPRPIVIVPLGEQAESVALLLADRLRRAAFCVELGFKGNAGKRMKRADKLGAKVALIMGDDELKRNAVALRDLKSGQQTEISLDRVEEALSAYKN